MASKWTDDTRFGERLKDERGHRGLTQPQLAKLLAEKGIKPMHATTIAKIEAGVRSVRINEAVGIADLFGVSLDSLLGRRPGAGRDHERAYLLRSLRDTSRGSSQQVWAAMETIRERLAELPEGYDELRTQGYDTWANRLYPAYDSLLGLVTLCDELLRKEQGLPPELPDPKVAEVMSKIQSWKDKGQK
jgi:transcriptional regulator with XRE-family HTH domain